ncbi:MAG: FAD:protein FMN transferase [Hyphomicrobium sp.]
MNRRRFLAISAAAAVVPGAARASPAETLRWHGVALGAEASLTLHHTDKALGLAALDACLAEIARLEAIFSLFRPDSALQRLNTAGRIDDAPADLRILVSQALQMAERSAGAFDPTIQPLWSLYARHFATPGASQDGPNARDVEAAHSLTGWRKVVVDGASIRFAQPGMAMTLNGIAQGYITDRAGDVLRARGFENVLIDLGETLALGPKWDGSCWTVAIANPVQPHQHATTFPLTRGAVATSGGYGLAFNDAGRFTHILDPKSGAPALRWRSVTVMAQNAALADALSTALSVVPEVAAPALLGPSAHAYVIALNGGAGRWI